jgi:AcrR family transcriptional regulator
MNRARTFDPSTALGQVVDLFSSKGYSETSMEDIVKTTGVSRYGLYGTFGNKRELFEQALEQYAEGMGKRSFLMAPQDEELRGVLQRFMKRMSKAFAIGLDSAKGRGEISEHVDVDAAGHHLTSTMFGLAVLGRTGFPKETLDGIVESTLDSLRCEGK